MKLNELLSSRDLDLFSNPEVNIPRRAKVLTIEKDKSQSFSDPLTLKDDISSFYRQTVGKNSSDKRGSFDIHCALVLSEQYDGLSWTSANIVKSLSGNIGVTDKRIKVLSAGHSSEHPVIFDIIPRKKMAKALRKILPKESSLHTFRRAGIIGLISMIHATSLYLSNEIADLANILQSGSFWLLTFGGFLAYIILEMYLSKHETNERIKKLDFEIDSDSVESEEGKAFRNEILANLAPSDFRIIIIDEFYRLDKFSREVLEEYLLNYRGAGASEFWVVVDAKNVGGSFMDLAIDHSNEWFFEMRLKIYETQLLEKWEKERIVRALDLPEENVEGRLLKSIIEGALFDGSWRLDDLVDVRTNKATRSDVIYGSFEMMYLLSFLSFPRTMAFSNKYYVDMLHEPGATSSGGSLKLRSRVLRKILHNSKLTRNEIRDNVEDLFSQKEYEDFVIEHDLSGLKKYSLVPELQQSLIANSAKLSLPKSRLVHLFWALYWGDKLDSHVETSWILKVSYHLRYCGNISIMDEQTLEQIYQRLFDIFTRAIDYSLKFLLLEEVSALTLRLLQFHEEGLFNERQEERIVRLIWEAYSLTLDSKYLNLLSKTRFKKSVQPSIESIAILNDVYIDYLPDDEDVTNLLVVKTMVVSQCGNTMLNRTLLPNGEWQSGRLITNSSLPSELVKNEFKNLLDKWDGEKRLSLSELQSLSRVIWLKGIADDRLYSAKAIIDLLSVENRNQFSQNFADQSDKSILFYERVLKLATNHKYEFLLEKSLVTEILLIANLSLLATIKELASGDLSEDVKSKLKVLLREFGQAVNIKEEHFGLNEEGILRIEGKLVPLINLKILSWRHVGLVHMSSDLLHRSLYYRFKIFKTLDKRQLELTLRPTQNIWNLDGVVSNMLSIMSNSDSIELKSSFALMILEKAQKIQLDAFNINEILGSIFFGHNHIQQGSVEEYQNLFDAYAISSAAREMLEAIAEESLAAFVLEYMNSTRKFCSKEIYDQSIALIREIAENIESEEVLTELKELIDTFDFSGQIRSSQNGVALEILAKWTYSKTGMGYASLLNDCFAAGHGNEMLLDEAITLIKNFKDDFQYSVCVVLSIYILSEPHHQENLAEEDHSVLVDYLDKGIRNWEHKFDSYINILVFSLLQKFLPGNSAEYKVKKEWWLNRQLSVDRLRIKNLIRYRRYFDVFLYCYKLLKSFGLKTDSPDYEIERARNGASEEERQAYLINGMKTPSAFSNSLNGDSLGTPTVSSEFIITGHYLFDGSANNQESDEMRRRFNFVAKEGLVKLFESMNKMPDIPNTFLTEVNEYKSLLDESLVNTPEDLDGIG